jgi:hypothetical protein
MARVVKQPAVKGRGGNRGGYNGQNDEEAPFQSGARADETGFDAADETKLAKSTQRAGKFGGLGGGFMGPIMFDGGFGGTADWADSSDDDLERDIPAWGDEGTADDDLTSAAGLALGGGAGRSGRRGAGAGAGASSDNGDDAPARKRDKAGGADDDEPYVNYWERAGLAADFREGDGLPEGLAFTSGTEATLLVDEDGSYSLQMPADEAANLSLNLGYEHGITSWSLEDDGKLHSFTLVLAIKCARRGTARESPTEREGERAGQGWDSGHGCARRARRAHATRVARAHARRLSPARPSLVARPHARTDLCTAPLDAHRAPSPGPQARQPPVHVPPALYRRTRVGRRGQGRGRGGADLQERRRGRARAVRHGRDRPQARPLGLARRHAQGGRARHVRERPQVRGRQARD